MDRTSIHELLEAARGRIARYTPDEARAAIVRGARVVDVRMNEQRSAYGGVAGALVFARNVLEWRLDPDSPWRAPDAPGLDDEVIVMCQHGFQSSLAAATLRDLGFTRAGDLDGGFEAWQAAGLPVEPA